MTEEEKSQRSHIRNLDRQRQRLAREMRTDTVISYMLAQGQTAEVISRYLVVAHKVLNPLQPDEVAKRIRKRGGSEQFVQQCSANNLPPDVELSVRSFLETDKSARPTFEPEVSEIQRKIENPKIRYLNTIRALYAVGDPRGRELSDEELTCLDEYLRKKSLSEAELQHLDELVSDDDLKRFQEISDLSAEDEIHR